MFEQIYANKSVQWHNNSNLIYLTDKVASQFSNSTIQNMYLLFHFVTQNSIELSKSVRDY